MPSPNAATMESSDIRGQMNDWSTWSNEVDSETELKRAQSFSDVLKRERGNWCSLSKANHKVTSLVRAQSYTERSKGLRMKSASLRKESDLYAQEIMSTEVQKRPKKEKRLKMSVPILAEGDSSGEEWDIFLRLQFMICCALCFAICI